MGKGIFGSKERRLFHAIYIGKSEDVDKLITEGAKLVRRS